MKQETEETHIGIFPSWTWLYASVVLYTGLLILVLYLITIAFDFSTSVE